MIRGHSDHGKSFEPSYESLSRLDSSVHLIYYDPSDLESLILIRMISKERTQNRTALALLLARQNYKLASRGNYLDFFRTHHAA